MWSFQKVTKNDDFGLIIRNKNSRFGDSAGDPGGPNSPGYAIAIGAPLCFAVTAVERSHIRINLLHMRMPERAQAVLNLLSAVSLAALAIFLAVFTVRTVQETQMFGSVAQTPWMTPLIWPQMFWMIGMGVFTLATILLALRALALAGRGNGAALTRDFAPETVEDELEAELSDLEARA